MVSRRRDETPKSLQDIITLLKETEPDDMPKFVAKELNKLPPVTFDHDIVEYKRVKRNLLLSVEWLESRHYVSYKKFMVSVPTDQLDSFMREDFWPKLCYTKIALIKYFIAAHLGAALYCEWFVYEIQPQFWQELECGSQDATCSKILFIADPQIQGDWGAPTPLNNLFSWDSDRYLKSTFSVVIRHFKPDVLVYMGDLMDEGSISTMPQFHGYVKRLSDIFEVNYSVVQVWIPGDNDIGGENEPIRKDKVMEFDKIFDQPSVVPYRNVTFYKVNGITHTFPAKSEGREDSLRIVVSHYATTGRLYGQKVNNEIRPNIYFCAHEHESKYTKQYRDFTHRETKWLNSGDKELHINFDDDWLYEIFVPTCSYRMGTSKIGYGAAVFENNNQRMRYTVFWSPQRFPYLFFYLAVLIILISYFLVFLAARMFYNNRSPNSRSLNESSAKLPLLERI